jgi:hypothetical protein
VFNWIDSVFHKATGAISSTIASWVHDLVRGLYSFLAAIFIPVSAAWNLLWKDVTTYADTEERYALDVVNALKKVFDWINKEGYEVDYYISNPEKLVDLLWDDVLSKLESTAEDTAEKIGTFALSFIYKNLKTVVTIAEDIIDAVF